MACTTAFGPKMGRKETGPTDEGDPENGKKEGVTVTVTVAAGEVDMRPPPRLGQFYDFFSFSHLTPPIQCQSSFSLLLFLLIVCFVLDYSLGYWIYT